MSVGSTVRNHLTHWSVVAVLLLQLAIFFGDAALQNLGFSHLAYILGIIPEVAFIIFAVAAELTGIPFMSVSNLLPFGIVLLVLAYYLSAVTLTIPFRAVHGIGRFGRELVR